MIVNLKPTTSKSDEKRKRPTIPGVIAGPGSGKRD